MRVVREDRLFGRRPRSGNDPFVRCAFAYPGQGPELVVDASAACVSLAYRRQGRDWIAGPRAGKEPICPFLTEFGEETSAQKLDLEVLRQLIRLDLPNDQRISRLPGLRIISGDQELRRERVA